MEKLRRSQRERRVQNINLLTARLAATPKPEIGARIVPSLTAFSMSTRNDDELSDYHQLDRRVALQICAALQMMWTVHSQVSVRTHLQVSSPVVCSVSYRTDDAT